jgi:effector-binding domain-containing protein
VQGAIALDLRYGLDRLAGLVEGAGAPRYSLEYRGVRDVAGTRYACLIHEGPLDGLAAAIRKGVAELRDGLASQGVRPSGEPLAVYARTNIKLRTTVCHIGIPIGDAHVDRQPVRELSAHRAWVVRVRGSRAGMEVAWYRAMQRMRAENIEPDLRLAPFERYLTAVDSARQNDDVTELHIPVRERT